MRVMNVSRPGSRSGSSLSIRARAVSGDVVGPSFTPMGLRILEVVDVCAVELARALSDPEEVRRRVVRGVRSRVDTRHRALVVHEQALVPGEELDALQLVEVRARGLHELDRAVDLGGHALVALIGRVLREALVPRVHLAEVGETTLRERADQVQRGRRRVVALEQATGVGRAGPLGEVVAVHDVAAVGRQRDVATGLGVARTRLRELSRHAAHLDDGHRGAVGQHDGHLQHRLDAVADLFGGRPCESLGTVATLEQECLTGCGARGPVAKVVDFAGEDQRRKCRDLLGDVGDAVRVGPLRLLLDGKRAPCIKGFDVVREHAFQPSGRWCRPDPREAYVTRLGSRSLTVEA